MELCDTHCHIHSTAYELNGDDPTHARWLRAQKPDPDELVAEAAIAGVTRLICVGTDLDDSIKAIEFVQKRSNCWASIGIHPHEASRYMGDEKSLEEFVALAGRPKIVAVGECGLDYFYEHSPKRDQVSLLEFQLDVAQSHNLPVIFHVREAFEDFWPIFDRYEGIEGVIHSFSATKKELYQILERGLYVGLNGIMTFTTNREQLEAAKALPLQKILLETDAPFLTPEPFRGTICMPKHIRVTAEFLSGLRNETLDTLAAASTQNAQKLFNI